MFYVSLLIYSLVAYLQCPWSRDFPQIHAASRFRCWGYSIPQTSVDPSVLCTATEAVANACKLRGIVGYFSIDFVTFIDPKSVSMGR